MPPGFLILIPYATYFCSHQAESDQQIWKFKKCGLRIQNLIQNAKSGPDTNDEPITRLAFQPCSSEHFDYEVEIISDLVTFFAMAVTTENTKTRK